MLPGSRLGRYKLHRILGRGGMGIVWEATLHGPAGFEKQVALKVLSDGGDGLFGPGDRVFFMGEVLRGTYSYLDPYSRFNCYRLSFDDESPLHGKTLTAGDTPIDEPARCSVHSSKEE